MASYMICQHDNTFTCCESIYIRDFKVDVYGKRLTSDTLFGTKNTIIDGEMFYLSDLFKIPKTT